MIASSLIAASCSHVGARLEDAAAAEAAIGFTGAVLVAQGERVLLDRAYGAERGVPMQTESRFWIASVGKQFTSVAILKCRSQGGLSLDDPIAKFLDGVPEDKRAITVRHLLAHLSGFDQSYVSEDLTDRSEAVRRMLSEPLIDAPGNKFHYSNNNYQLAVAILELACKRKYAEYVKAELFAPAGLTDTGQSEQETVVPARQDIPPRLSAPSWGGQAWYSTTRDLLRWYRALRSGRVLETRDVDALFEPVTPIGEGSAALGWFVGATSDGTRRLFTRGNEDFGANALIYAYPEHDIVIVVLSHGGSRGDISLSRAMHEQIEQSLFKD